MSVYGNAHAKDQERSILPSSCSLTSSTVARRRVHSRRYWWYSTLPVVVWLRSSQPERRLCCSLCPQNHIHLPLFCLFKLIPINHGFYASLHLRSSALSYTRGENKKWLFELSSRNSIPCFNDVENAFTTTVSPAIIHRHTDRENRTRQEDPMDKILHPFGIMKCRDRVIDHFSCYLLIRCGICWLAWSF